MIKVIMHGCNGKMGQTITGIIAEDADVEIVASYKVYNIKAVAFESALHQLFDKVQLKLSAGKATPKEWYVVPFRIIDEAVTRLIQGERIGYDHHLQRLILAK